MKDGAIARLVSAAEAVVNAYESMPDGELGRGLTNGHFIALRDALVEYSRPDPGALSQLGSRA